MSDALFLCGYEAYQVSNIIYAGPVTEIPENKRKGEITHSFKIITVNGTEYCRFKNEDSAKNARGALGAMLQNSDRVMFRHGHNIIDASSIVSFSVILSLKDNKTKAIIVTIKSSEEKSRKIWLRYNSEDHAMKGRKALFATIHSVNNSNKSENNAPSDNLIDSIENITEAVPF